MLHLLKDFKIKLPAVMYTIQRTILKIQSQQKSESLEQFKRDQSVSFKWYLMSVILQINTILK